MGFGFWVLKEILNIVVVLSKKIILKRPKQSFNIFGKIISAGFQRWFSHTH